MSKISAPIMLDRRSVIGLTLAGVAASASLAKSPVPRRRGISDELDAMLDSAAMAYGTIGFAVAVLRRGKLIYERYAGLADRELRTPINHKSIFPIFSISKLFLVVELIKAAGQGQIDLAMPVGRIREDLPDSWRAITLAQAIAQVSGLPDYIPDLVAPTEDEVFAKLRNKPLRFSPGTRNEYNQTNFLLAREALEQATGTPLTKLVERQFQAAKMRHAGYHTAYPGRTLELQNLVTSYRPVPGRRGPPATFSIPQWPAYTFGSTGIHTSLDDMVRWSRSLLGGELLPIQHLRASWAPFMTASGEPAWHTNGWEYFRHGDVTVVGHGGDVRLVWRHFFHTADPADGTTVIYFDNGGRSNFDRHRLTALLAERVMAGAARPTERQEEELFRGLSAGDWDDAVARLSASATDDVLEKIVNRVGYDALYILDANAALLALAWNARRFPNSANAHDSLGDAYRFAGKFDAARRSFERALALDPGNDRIKESLANLP